jgi:hypothetical protein
MVSSTTLQPSEWADLPPELLGQVIASLPFPDDLARFRAVCRPWHSAVREHVYPEVPWIIHADGTFVTTYDYGFHRRISFPDNTRFIGASGSWLALYRIDDPNDGQHKYLLHNPFTKTTVPLPGLDSVIGKVSNRFKIRKVLMRSDQDDFVVVATNYRKYPIILCRPGKSGAWLPEQGDIPDASICDVAFHEGNLYGVTYNKELIVLCLDEDDEGVPTVTSVEYVIENMPGDNEVDEEEANEDDGEALGNEYEEQAEYNDASSSDNEDEADGEASSNGDEEETDYKEASSSLDAVDGEALSVKGEFEDENDTMNKPTNEDNFSTSDDHEDVSVNEDEGYTSDALNGLNEYEDNEASSNISDNYAQYYDPDELTGDYDDGECDDGDLPRNLPQNYTASTRHLIESDGKLLMLWRRQRVPHSSNNSYTLDVEVVEADLGTGEWVPTDVTGTLYIGARHSQYVYMLSGEEDELTWYFDDEHDVMDPISQTFEEMIRSMSTWFFPQELVV